MIVHTGEKMLHFYHWVLALLPLIIFHSAQDLLLLMAGIVKIKPNK